MEITEPRRPVPAEIASPNGKLVYLTLLTSRGMSLEELQETLSLRKITLLAVLASLSDADLIDRKDDQWVITG